ncbi:uncharacterized protein [Arachis hypogaea]|uniref:uncharacterized protein n=1 Tax=Arachis hypogaea TaxID=3818 RepID=UPI003B213788
MEVKDLLRNDRSWNLELINALFSPDTAARICAVSLNEDGIDKITWAWNRNGKYDVASGYQIAYAFSHAPIEQFPQAMQNPAIWRRLWSLKMPYKIQLFLWKSIHEKLPVLKLLHQRFPTTLPICPRCGVEEETICHCLLRCKAAKEVWGLSTLAAIALNQPMSTFEEWWKQLTISIGTGREGDRKLTLCAILCWSLWKSRNQEIFEGTKTAPWETFNLAMKLQQEIWPN